jgi:hypothetical protein
MDLIIHSNVHNAHRIIVFIFIPLSQRSDRRNTGRLILVNRLIGQLMDSSSSRTKVYPLNLVNSQTKGLTDMGCCSSSVSTVNEEEEHQSLLNSQKPVHYSKIDNVNSEFDSSSIRKANEEGLRLSNLRRSLILKCDDPFSITTPSTSSSYGYNPIPSSEAGRAVVNIFDLKQA